MIKLTSFYTLFMVKKAWLWLQLRVNDTPLFKEAISITGTEVFTPIAIFQLTYVYCDPQ